MTQIKKEIVINAPREQVWDALADFGNIVKFNSNLTNSNLLGVQTEGVGMRRHCDMNASTGFDEVVTDWEQGYGYSVELSNFKGMPPMKYANAVVQVRDDGQAGRTIASFEFDYQFAMGVVGAMMDAAMAKRQFTTAAQRFVEGLKYHIETGNESNVRDVKRYIKAQTA